MTKEQEQLKAQHGTPDEFRSAGLNCTEITTAEANRAIAKYQQEWNKASVSGRAACRSEHQNRVDEFMTLAKQKLPKHPLVPDTVTRELRAKLIIEEALETIHALGCTLFNNSSDEKSRVSVEAFKKGVAFIKSTHQPDLVEILDGCCDLKVVTTGTLSACGIDDLEPQKLVDENNLAKFGPGHSYRDDGKLIKPPTHKPPNLKAELERQSNLKKTTHGNSQKHNTEQNGWAIQITRDDKSTFLASSNPGNYPAVWTKCNRKWAVKYKKELVAQGLPCRIVPVQYEQPKTNNPSKQLT